MVNPRSLRSIRRVPWLAGCAFALALQAAPALARPKHLHDISLWSCSTGYELVDLQPAFCISEAGDVVNPISARQPEPLTRGRTSSGR